MCPVWVSQMASINHSHLAIRAATAVRDLLAVTFKVTQLFLVELSREATRSKGSSFICYFTKLDIDFE